MFLIELKYYVKIIHSVPISVLKKRAQELTKQTFQQVELVIVDKEKTVSGFESLFFY